MIVFIEVVIFFVYYYYYYYHYFYFISPLNILVDDNVISESRVSSISWFHTSSPDGILTPRLLSALALLDVSLSLSLSSPLPLLLSLSPTVPSRLLWFSLFGPCNFYPASFSLDPVSIFGCMNHSSPSLSIAGVGLPSRLSGLTVWSSGEGMREEPGKRSS
ncbi:hypothetical protein BO82DRAFT_65780 [Aspergillus uvarum CBS 121591]|uniref:Uncharacterized protein n=1 Tax=Aspergillus uvarum CBS 121591 TaxID=1448315 RepID=A0A319CD31_9EURO|nr:hypothetical protein BO82DRAFT_65780 [Aspergillus uvarum CBS 121591]PYH82330.1 hypothetical protein BO82DRAFT_65780 [Aspergillus uvarum CBS 121591]